jgi:hypothetical protein
MLIMSNGGNDFQKQMDDAYASGDVDAILRLMATPQPPLNPAALEFVPRCSQSSGSLSKPIQQPATCDIEETGRGSGDIMVDENDTEDCDHDEGHSSDAIASLTAMYPDAASSGVVAALLSACNGDINATASSLADLDSCGALIDTEAFAEAVADFNEEFPSLGGPSTKLQHPVSRPALVKQSYSDGKLLRAVRLRHLIESFPWAPSDACEEALDAGSGQSSTAVVFLQRSHPKPRGWDASQAAKRESAMRAAVSPVLGKSVNTTECNWRDVGSAKWVATGSHVTSLYKATRAEARDEARRRNKYFGKLVVGVITVMNCEPTQVLDNSNSSSMRLCCFWDT